MTAFLLSVVPLGIISGTLAWLAATAPDGYEDERGFHYGEPDD